MPRSIPKRTMMDVLRERDKSKLSGIHPERRTFGVGIGSIRDYPNSYESYVYKKPKQNPEQKPGMIISYEPEVELVYDIIENLSLEVILQFRGLGFLERDFTRHYG